MKLSEYTIEKITEIATSDRPIEDKVRAILCRIDFDNDRKLNGGLLDDFSAFCVEEFMKGYRKAKEN